ncbi:MAG: ATP-binding protein, partial [Armatimonadota bacterium]
MPRVKIDAERCKQCVLCIEICPRDALKVGEETNSRGFYPVVMRDEDRCTGCGQCALVCPSVCIEVYR